MVPLICGYQGIPYGVCEFSKHLQFSEVLAIVRGNDILALHIEMALQMGQDFLHTLLKDASFIDLAHSL